MPAGMTTESSQVRRDVPAKMADRLIVALDVSDIRKARDIIEQLDGVVSFFKIGLWLAFADGVDGLISDLISSGKRVFLDAKMFDIGQTVEEGVARAADRGVSFVTVHGDERIIKAAMAGKRGRDIKIFAVTVLTSLSDNDLKEMGYALGAKDLVHLRVSKAVEYGCDGIIASPHDDPNEIRRIAKAHSLLIATPGVRPEGEAVHDHRRHATPYEAIRAGADYLVIGRPIIEKDDPAAAARAIIADMERASIGVVGQQ